MFVLNKVHRLPIRWCFQCDGDGVTTPSGVDDTHRKGDKHTHEYVNTNTFNLLYLVCRFNICHFLKKQYCHIVK